MSLFLVTNHNVRHIPVADPGGARTPDGGVNLIFDIIFDENCMKIKEIGLKVGSARAAPPRFPTESPWYLFSQLSGQNVIWLNQS